MTSPSGAAAVPVHRSLYEITGDIKDVNTLLVNVNDLRAASPEPVAAVQAQGVEATGHTVELTSEEVSAITLLLYRRKRPEFGWMEPALLSAEAKLDPLHTAIHNANFDAMDAAFRARALTGGAAP